MRRVFILALAGWLMMVGLHRSRPRYQGPTLESRARLEPKSSSRFMVACVNTIVRMWRERFVHSTGFDRWIF